MSVIRMQTPLEEIPLDKPSLLEDMLSFLSLYTTDKELFNSYEKDRGVLMKYGPFSFLFFSKARPDHVRNESGNACSLCTRD